MKNVVDRFNELCYELDQVPIQIIHHDDSTVEEVFFSQDALGITAAILTLAEVLASK